MRNSGFTGITIDREMVMVNIKRSEVTILLVLLFIDICHHAYYKITTNQKSTPKEKSINFFLMGRSANVIIFIILLMILLNVRSLKCDVVIVYHSLALHTYLSHM